MTSADAANTVERIILADTATDSGATPAQQPRPRQPRSRRPRRPSRPPQPSGRTLAATTTSNTAGGTTSAAKADRAGAAPAP